MSKCDKCGKETGFITHIVRNEYVTQGFPHDTKREVCFKCREKFMKYMTKHYDAFWPKEKEDGQ